MGSWQGALWGLTPSELSLDPSGKADKSPWLGRKPLET